MIPALVLAAGRSSRMGRAKALLPIGAETFLTRIVRTFVEADVEIHDGPDGLIGDRIPLASRITLACDALHAMTSDRPYRPAMTLERARQELRSCAGTQFDPQTIKALLAEIATKPNAPAPD